MVRLRVGRIAHSTARDCTPGTALGRCPGRWRRAEGYNLEFDRVEGENNGEGSAKGKEEGTSEGE